MLFQPSYPSPYLTDVDATQTNEFSCYINADGGTSVTSYKYSISDINGTPLYESSVTSVQPLYADEILAFDVPNTVGLVNGLDYMWNITLYESNPDIWVVYGTVQSGSNTTTTVYLRPSFLIEAGMYLNVNNELRLIEEYDSSTGVATLASALSKAPQQGVQYNVYSNNITSTNYFFRARTTPTLSMASVPSTIDGKSYTFKATYSQKENVGYKYYQWTIYDQGGNVINQSDETNTGTIEYTFDGFITNNTYGVSLMLENQDGIVLSIQPTWFKVSYEQPQIDNPPTATTNCDNDSIDLTWAPLLINAGQATSTTSSTPQYDFLPNMPFLGGSSIRITSGTNISWYVGSQQAPIYVPYDSTTFINWRTTDENFSGTIYKQEGEYVTLVAMSSSAPTVATTGDKYYNTITKLIYTAIGTNSWSNDGVEPRDDVIYLNSITSSKYIWEDGDLVTTTKSLPSYTITYSNGKFYYTIINDDINISSSVEAFLGSEYNVSQFWFKFTLLPTKLLVTNLLILATTWNDLSKYTWNEASAYTWNQLTYNKI